MAFGIFFIVIGMVVAWITMDIAKDGKNSWGGFLIMLMFVFWGSVALYDAGRDEEWKNVPRGGVVEVAQAVDLPDGGLVYLRLPRGVTRFSASVLQTPDLLARLRPGTYLIKKPNGHFDIFADSVYKPYAPRP